MLHAASHSKDYTINCVPFRLPTNHQTPLTADHLVPSTVYPSHMCHGTLMQGRRSSLPIVEGTKVAEGSPVRHTCTLPSQDPLQMALPLGLAATSSTASVCPLYTAKQLAGWCPSPDDWACMAGADHRRTVWSLAAETARGPCAEGRMVTALMPLSWAFVLLVTCPLPTPVQTWGVAHESARGLERLLKIGQYHGCIALDGAQT